MNITVPVTYQGGKQRLSKAICDFMDHHANAPFYDLCCGCGSISIELINRGVDPEKIHMVDAGPWGMFWRAIGNGSFDLNLFREYCNSVPEDVRLIRAWMETTSKQCVNQDAIYVFLLLQAGSFGGKTVWIRDDRWKHSGFRDYWLPTETSSRRYPVNPMMPMPDTLFDRISTIAQAMQGIHGYYADVMSIRPLPDSVIYIDPPYSNTTEYGYEFNLRKLLDRLSDCRVYVSEGKPVGDDAICLSNGRLKGGISGKRASANQEWITRFSL